MTKQEVREHCTNLFEETLINVPIPQINCSPREVESVARTMFELGVDSVLKHADLIDSEEG